MTPRYIIHATLDTADMRRSPRSEVGDDAIEAAVQIIDASLAGGEPIIPGLDDCILRLSAEGGACLATVIGPTPGDRGPIITYGIAISGRAGAGLWRLMHHHRIDEMPPLATDPERPPGAPWVAARLEIAAAFAAPETMAALGDFGRCLAWAWIERRGRAT